ncbi:MAG: ChbG/HpnK family deacetylase [Enterococcus sp.]
MYTFIINADDLGLSEGVNLGIQKSMREGIVKSTSVMINMPEARNGIQLIQELDGNFEINLHLNFTLGKPVTKELEKIATLVDEEGNFLTSSHYKNGGQKKFDYQEVYIEMENQIRAYYDSMGCFPPHMETHSVGDSSVGKALYDLAKKYQIHANLFYGYIPEKQLPYREAVIPDFKKLMTVLNRGTELEDFVEDSFGYKEVDNQTIIELHFHPAYIDQYLLDHSTLTYPRCKDLETLSAEKCKVWFEQTNSKIITFSELN